MTKRSLAYVLLGFMIVAGLPACATTPTTEAITSTPRKTSTPPPIPTRIEVTPSATPTASPSPTQTTPPPTPTVTATPTPTLIDYEPLVAALEKHLGYTAYFKGYYLGIGFVDIQTGQAVAVNGIERYHAMSSFKGPLAAYYLWLIERDEITWQDGDLQYMTEMLEWSSNIATTCILRRVGGIEPFNDWLAEQGLSRESNFLFRWQDWGCPTEDGRYVPENDWRYQLGDELLDIPLNNLYYGCPVHKLPCDKAFAPVELAGFYARLYRGEILTQESMELLFNLMNEETTNESALLSGLPQEDGFRVFVKGGTRPADDLYPVNFINEAGIVETPNGAFALAIFQEMNPEWPGTWPMSEATRIVYEHYAAAHPRDVADGD